MTGSTSRRPTSWRVIQSGATTRSDRARFGSRRPAARSGFPHRAWPPSKARLDRRSLEAVSWNLGTSALCLLPYWLATLRSPSPRQPHRALIRELHHMRRGVDGRATVGDHRHRHRRPQRRRAAPAPQPPWRRPATRSPRRGPAGRARGAGRGRWPRAGAPAGEPDPAVAGAGCPTRREASGRTRRRTGPGPPSRPHPRPPDRPQQVPAQRPGDQDQRRLVGLRGGIEGDHHRGSGPVVSATPIACLKELRPIRAAGSPTAAPTRTRAGTPWTG